MKKRIGMTLLLGSLIILLAACREIGYLFIPEVVRGSGVVVEKSFDASDFTKVVIGARFAGTIQYGETFSVVMRTDDNFVEYAKVYVRGDTLYALMERKNYQDITEQQITITMPALESIVVQGVSKAEVGGFPRTASLAIDVNSVSQLSGEIRADAIDLKIDTQSSVTLAGEGESLTLSANSLSSADLVKLPVTTANITLTNASNANVTVSDAIDLVASNNSRLTYGGGATLTSSKLEGESTATVRE